MNSLITRNAAWLCSSLVSVSDAQQHGQLCELTLVFAPTHADALDLACRVFATDSAMAILYDKADLQTLSCQIRRVNQLIKQLNQELNSCQH